jgi:hypothetical protein
VAFCHNRFQEPVAAERVFFAAQVVNQPVQGGWPAKERPERGTPLRLEKAFQPGRVAAQGHDGKPQRGSGKQ